MTTADQPTGYFNTTYAIEFTVNGTLDGTTVSPAIQDSPPTGVNVPDPQRLFRREVTDLGLIDPDYLVPEEEDARRGTKGNRLVTFIWIEGPTPGILGASVDVVDAVDGTAIVQKAIGSFVGDTKFFREGIFMPQASMLRVRGLSAAGGTPVKVRLHIQYLNNARDLAKVLSAICCIEDQLIVDRPFTTQDGGLLPPDGFVELTGGPVTIPLASETTGPIFLKNNTAPAVNIAMTPQAGDTINDLAVFALVAGETTILKSDGVSRWLTF